MNIKLTIGLCALGIFLALPVKAMEAPPKEAQEKFYQATSEANVILLTEAIEEGANVNTLSDDPFKMNVLHLILASEEPLTKKQDTFFKALLKEADLNTPSGTGETAFHFAAKKWAPQPDRATSC